MFVTVTTQARLSRISVTQENEVQVELEIRHRFEVSLCCKASNY